MVVAGLDHRIRMCNPGATRMFCYESKEIIGKKSATLYESRSEFERLGNLQADSNARGEPRLDEGAFRRKGGEIFPADVVCSVIRDADGEPIGFVDLIRDITERKSTEMEQAALQEQIHQSQKLESLGTLAGGIAHDFNNLLAIINGYSDLVIEELEPGSIAWNNTEEIRTAGRRAVDLVQPPDADVALVLEVEGDVVPVVAREVADGEGAGRRVEVAEVAEVPDQVVRHAPARVDRPGRTTL